MDIKSEWLAFLEAIVTFDYIKPLHIEAADYISCYTSNDIAYSRPGWKAL